MTIEEKNNKAKAKILVDRVKKECGNAKIIIPMLDVILRNTLIKDLDGWNWKIAKFIDDHTSYISVDIHTDISFRSPKQWWNSAEVVRGAEKPVGLRINDKDNLVILRQEVDDILNHTTDKISKFISMRNKPKWNCQNYNCGRFLGKELVTIEEVKRLLRDFSIEEYWDCRTCGLLNYFELADSGAIIFKTGSVLDLEI